MLSSSLVGLLSECEASLAYLGGKSPFSKALTAVAQCLVWCVSPFLVSEHGRKGFLRFNKLLGNFSFQLNLSFLLFRQELWLVRGEAPSQRRDPLSQLFAAPGCCSWFTHTKLA